MSRDFTQTLKCFILTAGSHSCQNNLKSLVQLCHDACFLSFCAKKSKLLCTNATNTHVLWFLLSQVEEARKKMFNGTISTGPQTLTVVASQISSRSSPAQPVHSTASKPLQQTAASVLQSLPCQLLGQSSLVLTPVANGSTVTCAPLALTVATQVQKPS